MEKTPHQKLLARLHLVASQKGYTHEDLHDIAVQCGKKSLKECTEDQLLKFINWIDKKPKNQKIKTPYSYK